jgi:modulator of FtsH protease HflC
VAVRLRRMNYPEEVRTAVFEQIRSERQRVAAANRAEGESQARIIRSAADRDRAGAVAQAESDAAKLIGEGEAQAARIANEAHAVDPAFYQFLKTLETYRSALDVRTTLVLSAESRFLQLLTQGIPDSSREKPDREKSNGVDSTSPVAATGTTPSSRGTRVLGSEPRPDRAAAEDRKP